MISRACGNPVLCIMITFLQCDQLTLKAPITTAADDKFCDIYPSFRKNKV